MPSAFSSLAPLGKNSATRFLVLRLQLCALDKVHRHGISNFDEEWYGKDKHLHTLILAPVFSNLNFGYDIGHFGRYHNTLCLSPQILHKHCFQWSHEKTGKTMLMQNLGGTNKEYYGIFCCFLLFHNSAVSYLQALCAKLRFGFPNERKFD